MASGSAIKAGEAYVAITANDTELQNGLKRAQAHLKAFASFAASAGGGLMALGSSIVGPIMAAAKYFSDVGDQLDKMALRTGVAVETLSELQFAAGQSGTSIEAVEKSIKAMQRQILAADLATRKLGERGALDPLSEEAKGASNALKAVGLTLDDLRGLSPEKQFERIAEAINGIDDDSMRAGAAMQIFGKSGADLLPMLRDMQALRDEARALGVVMSTEDAKSAAELNDAFGRLATVGGAAWTQLGAAVAPALTEVINGLAEGTKWVIDFIREIRTLVTAAAAVGGGIVAAGASLVAFGGLLYAGSAAISGYYSTIKMLTAIATTPIPKHGATGLLERCFTLERPEISTIKFGRSITSSLSGRTGRKLLILFQTSQLTKMPMNM